MLNTQAIFGYFEKTINNTDSVNVLSPVKAIIKNAKISFVDPTSTSSVNGNIVKPLGAGDGCEMSFYIQIDYSIIIYPDGSYIELFSVTLRIDVSCGGGIGGDPSSPDNGNNWWNYGTGWPWNNPGGPYYSDPNYYPGSYGYENSNWYWWWTNSNMMGYYYQGVYVSPLSYPGMESGYPFEWWNDDNWIANNFSLNIDAPIYNQYKKLTYAERQWVKAHPFQAIEVQKNMRKAYTETGIRFTDPATPQIKDPKLNTKADAFRHAYWCALNTLSIGSTYAQEVGDNHESETVAPLIQEKDMDLFNNSVGINAGIYYFDPNTIGDVIYNKLLNGDLRYLKPLDYTQSPGYDVNNDGIQDCPYCRNGFIPGTTVLTPTNQ